MAASSRAAVSRPLHSDTPPVEFELTLTSQATVARAAARTGVALQEAAAAAVMAVAPDQGTHTLLSSIESNNLLTFARPSQVVATAVRREGGKGYWGSNPPQEKGKPLQRTDRDSETQRLSR